VSEAASSYAGNIATPRVKTLIASLTQLIEELEARGATNAFTDHEIWPRIAKTCGFYCDYAVLQDTALEPGILFTWTTSGQPRTTYLEYDVVAFLQDWLDSDQASNARQSLAGRDGLHVLTLMASRDGPASGMIHTLEETPGEIPATALRLPPEVDVLIVATSAEVLRFALHDGWSRCNAPPSQ
jgi:hypothetical protein